MCLTENYFYALSTVAITINVSQNKARALKNTLRGFYKLLGKDIVQRLISLEQYRMLSRILRYVKITKLNVNSQK